MQTNFWKTINIERSSHFDVPSLTRVVIKKGINYSKAYYPSWASTRRLEALFTSEWAKKNGVVMDPYITPSSLGITYIFSDSPAKNSFKMEITK